MNWVLRTLLQTTQSSIPILNRYCLAESTRRSTAEEPHIWDIMKTNAMPATATAFCDNWDSQVKVKVHPELVAPIFLIHLKDVNALEEAFSEKQFAVILGFIDSHSFHFDFFMHFQSVPCASNHTLPTSVSGAFFLNGSYGTSNGVLILSEVHAQFMQNLHTTEEILCRRSYTNSSISLVPPVQESLKIPTVKGKASHNGMCIVSIFDVNPS
eukprot:scaffold24561_cov64-Attheya_sp.AAC.1